MKIIKPSYVIETPVAGEAGQQILERIERAGRTCYKTEMSADGPEAFVQRIIERGHESVIEHVSLTVRFICDRGVSHELVRHRLCAFSQESTRYCNYSAERFGKEITVIEPPFWARGTEGWNVWERACAAAERAYFKLLEIGARPQEARSVLPNSLKTEIVVTANLREWRHIFRLRCAPVAHPQMQELMVPLLGAMKGYLPVVFGDLSIGGGR